MSFTTEKPELYAEYGAFSGTDTLEWTPYELNP